MAITSETYVLSSHGSLMNGNSFTLPQNVTVHFYCLNGSTLSDDLADEVWDALTSDQTPKTPIAETITGGNMIDNYKVYGGEDAKYFRRRCGLFKLKFPQYPFDYIIEDDINTTLKDIINKASSKTSGYVTIHYLACRG